MQPAARTRARTLTSASFPPRLDARTVGRTLPYSQHNSCRGRRFVTVRTLHSAGNRQLTKQIYSTCMRVLMLITAIAACGQPATPARVVSSTVLASNVLRADYAGSKACAD